MERIIKLERMGVTDEKIMMEMVTQKGAGKYGDKQVRRSFLIINHSQSLPPSDQIW